VPAAVLIAAAAHRDPRELCRVPGWGGHEAGAAEVTCLISLPTAEPSHAHRPDCGAGVRGLPQAEPAAHPAERGRAGGRRQREERGRPGHPRYSARVEAGPVRGPCSRADKVCRATIFPSRSLPADTCGERICTAIWPVAPQAQAGILPSKEPSLGVSRHPRRHPPCWEPISSAWDSAGRLNTLRARLHTQQTSPHCFHRRARTFPTSQGARRAGSSSLPPTQLMVRGHLCNSLPA